MKLLLLTFGLLLVIVCNVKATTFEELVVEQLEDLIESEEEKRQEEFERRDKSYLTAQKHPEKLRQCVKCVGVQREKGLNVKQATNYCNKICKRDLFDTRQLYLREFNDEELF